MKLIVNSILEDTAVIKVTDGSDTNQTAETETAKLISKGPRHLYQTQTGTGARRYVYINTAGGLSCDTCVIVRADRHNGKAVKIKKWSDYTASVTDVYSSGTWAPTLLGPLSQDAILENLGISSVEAVGLELGSTYSKTISQVYFGTAFVFDSMTSAKISLDWDRIQLGKQSLLTDYSVAITAAMLTRAEVNTFESLFNLTTEPCFLYDSDEVWLPDKLWHVAIPSYSIQPLVNDLYDVSFTAHRLRAYL